jgi:Rhomboid family
MAGISAALAQMLMEPYSSAPLIGASGAISGVLGAFFICNPAARITLVLDPALICFLRRLTIRLPACLGSPTGVVFLTDFHGSETAGLKRGVLGTRRMVSYRSDHSYCGLPVHIQGTGC